MRLQLGAVLLAVVLAGCFTDSPEPSETIAIPEAGLQMPKFSECSYWIGFFSLPGQAHPGSTPDGWEAGVGAILTTLALEVRSCERIGFGTFERGPVNMAIEWHYNINIPDSCEETFGDGRLITNMVVSDAELAEALTDTFGMPAIPGDVEMQVINDGSDAQTVRWTIQPENSGPTILDIPRTADETENFVASESVRFWDNGRGISVMSQASQYNHQDPSNSAATAMYSPPFDGASVPGDLLLGRGTSFPEVRVEAEIIEFEDYTCGTEA